MKRITPLCLLGAVVSVSPSVVMADPPAKPQTLKQDYQARIAQTSHVDAAIMAWWLDPVHNPAPAGASMEGTLSRTKLKTNEPQSLDLWQGNNPGLQMVVPQKGQNRLTIVGTPEAIAMVEEMVTILDQKWKEVEVVAQYVQIEPQDLLELGVRDHAGLEPDVNSEKFDVWMVQAGIQERLNTLVEAGKAKIIKGDRVVTKSSSYAKMEMASGSPASLLVSGGQETGGTLNTDGKTEPLEVQILWSLFVMPTVNNDKSISLQVTRTRTLALSNHIEKIPLKNYEETNSIVNVRDMGTIALNGLKFNASVTDAIAGVKGKNVVLLLTPTIVQPAN